MMGQGFGDEIGKGLIRFMVLVLVFVLGGGLAIGLYSAVDWILKHIAINWK